MYDFNMPDGSVMTRNPDQDGDEAIDAPAFDLLKEVLRELDLTGILASEPLILGALIANGSFETEWEAGQSPPDISEGEWEVRRIFSEPLPLDCGGWMFTEEIDGELVEMMWTPTSTKDREKAARFAQAIAKIDWSDYEVHEVRY